MSEYGDEQTISDILEELKPGGGVTFDSGHVNGSISVRRSTLPAVDGSGDPSFVVSGVTSSKAALTAGEAQADVGRRRRIRDQAEARRAELARERGFGS